MTEYIQCQLKTQLCKFYSQNKNNINKSQSKAEDVRLIFEDEENKGSHLNQSGWTDGLQGKGEEWTLNNSDVSELQKIINSKANKDEIFNTVYENEEANLDDEFINFKPKIKSEISKNHTKSIPRPQIRPQSGRNVQSSNISMNHNSFITPTEGMKANTILNYPQIPLNKSVTQNVGFNQQFGNVPPAQFNILAQKAWSSTNKQQMENMRQNTNPNNNVRIDNDISRRFNPSLKNNRIVNDMN